MTTAASDPQIVPQSNPRQCLLCVPPTRAWPTTWTAVLSDNTQPRLRRPVASLRRMVQTTVGLRSLLAEPLTVASYMAVPRQLRHQHRHYAARHQRNYQGAQVGEARIAVSGPRCACRFERDGEDNWQNPSGRPKPSAPTCSP